MLLILELLLVFIFGNFVYESFANDVSQSSEDIYNVLKSIQSEINAKEPSYCYHGHSGTRNAFISNSYQKYTKNLNILIYPFCLVTHELGNLICMLVSYITLIILCIIFFITIIFMII